MSIIQNYIRKNPQKDIKFIILDVNGEYKRAFGNDEAEYVSFNQLRFHHTILSNPEYGQLFRAAEGVQYPALKDCIKTLKSINDKWDLKDLPEQIELWIDNHADIQNGSRSTFSKNQINGFLRTMSLRIDGILEEPQLMTVINASDGKATLDTINYSNKKVIILDLQVSNDFLDIVVYLFFKAIYEYKSQNRDTTHLNLVLEEAHRYIIANANESRLGSYYIDKLSREGRKFGIGLIIASQIPSLLAYEVVSQCNSVIMHKITSKRDMEFLRNVLRVSNDTFYLQMSALEKQHAVVCGEAFPNDSIVRIHDAKPLPRSNDPEIEDILFPFEEGVHNYTEMDTLQAKKHENLGIKEPSVTDVPEEIDKWDKLIEQLQDSCSFASTHQLIARLSKNKNWNMNQIQELCRAVEMNTQVEWLLGDSDVEEFYNSLLDDIVIPQTGPVKNVYDMLHQLE